MTWSKSERERKRRQSQMVQLSELHERDCRITIGNILEEIFSSVKIDDSIKSLMRELNLFKIKWKL